MTRLAVLLLFILVYPTVTAKSKGSDSLAPHAIKSIIDEFYAKNVHEVEVINFGKKNGQGSRIIEKLLSIGDQSIPVRVTRDARNLPKVELKAPSILLFDSPENMNQVYTKIVIHPFFNIRHHHLFYVPEIGVKELQVSASKTIVLDNIDFLVNETRHSIELVTAFWFTPEACHKNQFRVINRFTRERKRWESSNFFEEKYRNFHQCPIEMRTEDIEPFELMLADELNYTVKVANFNKLDAVTPITFYLMYLQSHLIKIYNLHSIEIEQRKIFIPPGELYGDYEKMFLPFDTSAWIAIGVTILLSVSTTIVIKWKLPKIQTAVFGSNNRSPLMNFVSILINGCQMTNLVENAPRLFLLNFLFWSLIIR
jgi:hypothetical protein